MEMETETITSERLMIWSKTRKRKQKRKSGRFPRIDAPTELTPKDWGHTSARYREPAKPLRIGKLSYPPDPQRIH
jgi:hypothetical protein